jgi:hypothetical protein
MLQPSYAYLAVDKSATSVQDVPFQNSVCADTPGVYPPKSNARSSEYLNLPKSLAVFKSVTSVQVVPFQVSSNYQIRWIIFPPQLILLFEFLVLLIDFLLCLHHLLLSN